MNKAEAMDLIEQEKDFPVKSRMFRDVRDNSYHTSFNMMDIRFMEEVV